MFLVVVMMTSMSDLVVPVILVGFSISWFKLKVEIKSRNDLVSGLEASRLQFRPPSIIISKFRSNASTKLLVRVSKHLVGASGGQYVLQTKSDL